MSLLDTASLIVTPNGYKEGKLYSVIPSDGSGDMSVTRATTATRVNSAGFVELVPYNLMLSSEDFTTNWVASGCSVTANTTTAPNGTTTADTITDSSTFGYVYLTSASVNTSQIVTHSVFLKRTNNDWINVSIARGGATTYGELGVWFNLATGAIGSNFQAGAGVLLDSEITDEGNGWYRCSITGYVTNAVSYVPYVFNSNADNSFTSSSGQSRYQWGAQVNEGTIKDYQKTETRLNIPRLDYSNGTCPSLLVEPQRTNISQYVESGNGGWSTGTISSASNIVGLKAFNVLNNYGLYGDAAYILSNANFGANTPYTLSFYTDFDQCTGTDLGISFLGFAPSLAYAGININKATKAITTYNVGGVFTLNSYEAIQVSGEIYKIVVTATPNASASGSRNYIGTGSDGTSAVFAGVQLEAGSYATSYIQKTTGASVTRNADVISKTGISSLIGQTEGTLFWDVDFQVVANNDAIFLKENATFDTFVFMQKEPSGIIACGYYGSGALQARIESSAVTTGRYKIAFAYKNNDFVMYLNGTQVGTDTSGTVSGLMDYFDLHWTESGCNNAYASALWKTRLTNTQLAQLTTI